ncbi:hypothetical protein ACQPW1_19175 [Nocardia sp. CA-128927]|uniref:hypothetical protein n=1 Tax=Nocardia sp. CA-128927 TaxID=3239975 RepID=UPI003D973E81
MRAAVTRLESFCSTNRVSIGSQPPLLLRTLTGTCDSTIVLVPFALVNSTESSVRADSFDVFGSKPLFTGAAAAPPASNGVKSASGSDCLPVREGFATAFDSISGTSRGFFPFGAAAACGDTTTCTNVAINAATKIVDHETTFTRYQLAGNQRIDASP